MKSLRIRKVLILLVLALFCSGCYRISYRLGSTQGQTYRNQYWNNYFVFGLIPDRETYDLEALCRSDQLIRVRTYQKPANVMATLLGVLVAADTVEAECAPGAVQESFAPHSWEK